MMRKKRIQKKILEENFKKDKTQKTNFKKD